MRVFDDRVCVLGEGPFFDDRTGRVGWVDILGSRVLWRTFDSDEAAETPTPGHVGAAVPRDGGGLVLCLPDGPALLDPDGALHVLDSFATADAEAGVSSPEDGPPLRANDAKADPAGRLWLGTMAYDETPGAGALYRLDPGATRPVRVFGGVTVSNGLGWSPDLQTMYYIDSPTQRIDAIEYDPRTGDVGERRPFATINGAFPDGLCVDAEGGVWVALWGGGGVRRHAADGSLDRSVTVPTPKVTSCAFAGPDLGTLIITTAADGRPDGEAGAGLTYAYVPGDVTGLPLHRYTG